MTVHLISVIVPCRNERAAIEGFCASALGQQLPPDWGMELLVADGLSDDGTREALAAWAARDARLRVIDNPGRIVSCGLNAALGAARGEVIARLDAHTEFAPDYLAECLAALARTGADNVGGPWVARGRGAMGRAIAAAFQCRWVAGGARSRDRAYEGLVDTVYLGCWPRAAFERWGSFDETLVRNQDDEHNLRLRLGGARVWQSPRIRSWYQPRNSLGQLFRQQLQYGYWRPFVMRKHGQPGAVRQLAPALLVAALAAGALLAPWRIWPLAALLAVYGLYLALASVLAAAQAAQEGVEVADNPASQNPSPSPSGGGQGWGPTALARRANVSTNEPPGPHPSPPPEGEGERGAVPSEGEGERRAASPVGEGTRGILPRLPAVIAAYHLGYGLGTWRGLWDLARGRRVSAAAATLTR